MKTAKTLTVTGWVKHEWSRSYDVTMEYAGTRRSRAGVERPAMNAVAMTGESGSKTVTAAGRTVNVSWTTRQVFAA